MLLSSKEKETRQKIEKALIAAGGDPSRAILCEGPNTEIYWVCPRTEKTIIATPVDGSSRPKRLSSSKFKTNGGEDLHPSHFPGLPPTEHFDLERRMECCKHSQIAHNGRAYLAWYRQGISAQKGLLTQGERREVARATSRYKEALDRMLQTQI